MKNGQIKKMIEYYEFGGLNFEWDEQKANEVQQNHNVTFQEACTIFLDFDEFTTIDDRFHYDEERYQGNRAIRFKKHNFL